MFVRLYKRIRINLVYIIYKIYYIFFTFGFLDCMNLCYINSPINLWWTCDIYRIRYKFIKYIIL